MSTGGNSRVLGVFSTLQFTEGLPAAMPQVDFLLMTRFAEAGEAADLDLAPSQSSVRTKRRGWNR